MSAKKPTADLEKAIESSGFIPRKADVPALLDLLRTRDQSLAEHAERALARLGAEALRAALAVFDQAEPPQRGRLVRLVGRVDDASTVPFLIARLSDRDAKTQRNAAIALGKPLGRTKHEGVEEALLARLALDPPLELQRSIVASLGKIGGAAALEKVRAIETDDRELGRIVEEARLKLERTLGRAHAAPFSLDRRAARVEATQVRLHCRPGLEDIVVEEVEEAGAALAPTIAGEGCVEVMLRGPLQPLRALRTPLRVAFPLARARGDAIEVVATAITSQRARSVLAAFGRGTLRYRIEWASAGHRRRATFEVARRVSHAWPELVNDPTESAWEGVVKEVVEEREGLVDVELWPRGLADERFRYRVADVPGASHPTLAAALAHVSMRGAPTDEVVWDPFVGSGTELVERALLGPYERLIGSDTRKDALSVARQNLGAAKVQAELLVGDARMLQLPARPSLVITNPPMGRRVLHRDEIAGLYDAFLAHAAAVLREESRIVWISPLFERSARSAQALGFRTVLRQRVDMGGFSAELQVFRRGGRA